LNSKTELEGKPVCSLHAVPRAYLKKWQRVADSAAEICLSAAALVIRAHPDHMELLVSSLNAENPFKTVPPGPLTDCVLCRKVVEQRNIFCATDLSDSCDSPRSLAAGQGMLSYLGVPLIWPDGSVFGVLCVLDSKPRDYSTALRNLLLQFKEIIEGDFRILHYSRILDGNKAILEEKVDERTLALKDVNVQLKEQLAQRLAAERNLSRELRVSKGLAKLSKALIDSGQSIKTIAENTLAAARELTGSKHGYVSEIDIITGENVGHTLTAMFGNACRVTGPDQRIAFPQGADGRYGKLWGHALNTGESFFTNAPASHSSSAGLPEGHVPLRRFLSVPAKYDGKVIGQIALANADSDYTEAHIEVIQRLAELYTIALQRHRHENERIVLEKQLRHGQKMEALGTLAGGVAHDFNNILAAIVGYSELTLLDENLFEKPRKNLKEILTAAQRAKSLVMQILTFSRKGEEQKKPVSIHLIVKEAMRLVQQTVPSTIHVKTNIDSHTGMVLADTTQLHQVVVNLCTNAYHAMLATGGELAIDLAPIRADQATCAQYSGLLEGPYAQLTVRDTGTGIPADKLPRIFDPFFTTKEVGEGSGMGLAVVHGIVQGCDGIVHVESSPGQGSVFRVFLPLTRQKSGEESTASAPDLKTGDEHILLVDDESVLTELVTEMLESLGYLVTSFTSSEKALKAFEAAPQSFDLLLTDLTMPGVTGDVLARETMRCRPGFPVVICTGHSAMLDGSRLQAMGVRALLSKPYELSSLAETLRQALSGQA
jgi:signal transduction histidine kinase/CheY-like chemotaxis protein